MMRNADARTVCSRKEKFNSNGGHDTRFGDFKLQITSMFMVRNIKCGYSFSKLGREEHNKFERQLKTLVSNYFWSTLVNSSDIFDCRLSGVVLLYAS